MIENEAEDRPSPEDVTDASPDPAQDTELAILGDVLQDHGVTRVLIRYEGSGDSGCVDEVTFEPQGVRLPEWVEYRLRELAEGYCPHGYENEAGGYGSLTLYPPTGLATLEHFDRYEESEVMDAKAVRLSEVLRQRLIQLQITTITATFDGYGDSGRIHNVSTEPEGIRINTQLRHELEDFLLEQLPGGWEINEGSYGDFTVDVSAGEVEADAHWRTEEDSGPQFVHWQWRK
jgi:hypothetical protein